MKKLGIIVGVLAIIAIILLAIPMEIVVEKSTIIEAPRSSVYENVSKFENFQKWSPWADLDPTQKVTITGNDGEVGAQLNWKSTSDEVGVGSQRITSISNDRIDLELEFTAPWQSKSEVYYTFTDKETGVEVLWGYKGEGNLMMKTMISGMLGETYEKGLASLKTLSENVNTTDI